MSLKKYCGAAVTLLTVAALALAVANSAAAAVPDRTAAPKLGMGPAHWWQPGKRGKPGKYGTWGKTVVWRPASSLSVFAVDQLANAGNNEIMPTTRTHLIFWLPAGFHFSSSVNDANYEAQMIKYFQDVGGSQILNTATQYSGNNGTVADTSTFVDSIVDTTAFPHTGADVAHAVTQGDLNTEIFNQIGAHGGWNKGMSEMYFIFLPDNLVDCNNALTSCNTNKYCAYHTYGYSGSDTPANDFVWADIPDNRSVYSAGGCGDSNVTGDRSADTTLSSVEHEHLEAVTDPRLNAWQDSTGGSGENGDKCNRNMGVANSSSSIANNYLGGGAADLFRIQREWSNAASGCAASYTTTGSHVESPAPTGGDVTLSVAEATIAGNPADSLDYTLTFKNPSNQDDAYSVTVTNTLPAGVQSGGSGTVVFNLGDLAPHQSVTRTFTAHPTGPLLDGTVLTNSAVFAFNDSTGTAQPTITRTASTTVANAPPTLSLPGPQSVDFNDPLSFGISASDADSGDTLTLSAVGLPAGLTFTDNGDGTGTVSGTDTADPGTYVVTFSADDHHHLSPVTGTVTITVNQEESALAYTGALTADYHDPAVVSATLTDPDGGAPIAGKQVTFTIGVGDTCTAVTDVSGNASCTIVPTQAAGTVPVVASFAGGTDYQSSSDTKSFVITKEETTTTYTGPTVILQGGSGVTLQGLLLEDGNPATPIAGRTLTLSLGAQSCTGTTGVNGVASCTLIFSGPLGPEPLVASFAGDAYYLPSSDATKEAIVFAMPDRGAFVLGDDSVAGAGPSTTVTWWSDSWSTLDSLTGGAAPPSFKGFAGTVSLPTSTPPASCAGPWTTAPGNSTPPVGSIPSYMGVMVSSLVGKSGKTISGNAIDIVVVRTDPGYAPNPGHPGTGTIVATFC
jgi:hypothetical protein